MPKKLRQSGEYGYLLAIGQVGIEMVVPIGLGVGLDMWLGTMPWITVASVMFGLFAGIVHLLVLVDRMDKAVKSEPPSSPQEPQ
jgi:F0F1-type ATP synthase assembly protein I